MFKFVLQPLGIPNRWRLLAVTVSCLSNGILSCCVAEFRCASILVWLEGLGKAGRNVLKALAFALILLGPINNIAINSKELSRVIECTSFLTYSLAKTKFDLAVKPFTNALTHMDQNLSDVKYQFKEINKLLNPILQEVERHDVFNQNQKYSDQTAPAFYSSTYKQKLMKRCELQVERGVDKCEKAFEKAFKSCLEKALPLLNNIVCLPMKIDFICNVNNFVSIPAASICDPSSVIDLTFGKEYVHLKETGKKFSMHYGNVSVNYTTSNVKEVNVLKSINATSRVIAKKLDEKVAFIDSLVNYVQKFMIFIYFKVIYDAINFHDDYLSEIEFNNFYITNYFKKIDRRRVRDGRSNVLPIKNAEIGKFVDLDSSNKISREFEGYVGLYLKIFLQVLSATFFVLVDRLFFELLEIIARHSRVNYLQEGAHNLSIKLNGTGFIANLIRGSFDALNVDEHIKVVMTNEPCLPRPVLVESWKIIRIYLLFLLNLYLIYNQVYIHRSKRFVCSYFYPKREKERVLYLYNKMLKRRKNILKLMVRRVEEKLKVHRGVKQEKNFFQKALRTLPTLCKCLRCFPCARPKCFICNETQARKMTKDSIYYLQCQKRKCRIIYCEQCWFEIGRRCLPCRYRRNCDLGEEKEIVLDYADLLSEHYKTDRSD